MYRYNNGYYNHRYNQGRKVIIIKDEDEFDGYPPHSPYDDNWLGNFIGGAVVLIIFIAILFRTPENTMPNNPPNENALEKENAHQTRKQKSPQEQKLPTLEGNIEGKKNGEKKNGEKKYPEKKKSKTIHY